MAISPTSTNVLKNSKLLGSSFIEEMVVTFAAHDAVYSSVFDKRNVGTVLFLFPNTCDQSLEIELQAGLDATFADHTYVSLGHQDVATNVNDYAKLSDPWAYVRLKVTPVDAPTEASVTFYATSADKGRD
jgi:hypothetical protein